MTPARWGYVAVLAAAVLADIGMTALGMGPSTPLIIALVSLILVAVWSRRSLATSIAPLRRRSTIVRAVDRPGADAHVRGLRTSLLFGRTTDGHADRVCQVLVELIDDQLRHRHGIGLDADHAPDLLGDQLTRFVDNTNAGQPVSDPEQLRRVVALVERL